MTEFHGEHTHMPSNMPTSPPFPLRAHCQFKQAEVLPRYCSWLRRHGLIDSTGAKVGKWSICTWSDADIGGQLVRELRQKHIAMPAFFEQWINLKVSYKQHYKTEAKGGLKHCVERLGIQWQGRAHNGLVDSRNTAAIVLHMARGSIQHGAFVFRRSTRGLDAEGEKKGRRAAAGGGGWGRRGQRIY